MLSRLWKFLQVFLIASKDKPFPGESCHSFRHLSDATLSRASTIDSITNPLNDSCRLYQSLMPGATFGG